MMVCVFGEGLSDGRLCGEEVMGGYVWGGGDGRLCVEEVMGGCVWRRV